MNSFNLKKITLLSLLISISIILSYLETLINLFPYLKIGLSNIVIVICIYQFKFKESIIVVLLKVILLSLIIGTFLNITFILSFSGGFVSFIIMYLFKKVKSLSVLSISVLGSLTHTLTQIIVVSIITSSKIIYLLPVYLLISIVTGIFIGLFSSKIISKMDTYKNT